MTTFLPPDVAKRIQALASADGQSITVEVRLDPGRLAPKVLEAAQRADVVREARSWLGTPWVHMARAKGHGVDCAQLLAAVYEAVGLVGPVAFEPYPQDWALHRDEQRLRDTIERYAMRVDRLPLPGDIALFRYGRSLSHAGIVIGWPCIVHAYLSDRAVVISSVEADSALAARFAGCWSCWKEG